MVPVASVVAVSGVPCVVDEHMRTHEREQLEKLRKEARSLRNARFTSPTDPSQEVELVRSLLPQRTPGSD